MQNTHFPPMTGPTIAIVDYGLGNLFSIQQACARVGLAASITSSPESVCEADGAVLPGVGAFPVAMESLNRLGLAEAIHEVVRRGRPLIGVCLGMQLLMSTSEEFGNHPGLDLIPGSVRRFPRDLMTDDVPVERPAKVPRMGWGRVMSASAEKWDQTLLRGLPSGVEMYFVHSYYAVPESPGDVVASSTYGGFEHCVALARSNVFGCQFHPERSGDNGLHIYENLAAWVRS